MRDTEKSKAQLILELQQLREHLLELEKAQSGASQSLERIITLASTRLIALEAGEIDAAIQDVLGEVGCFTGVDRSYVFLFSPEVTRLSNTHEWCAPGIAPQIEYLQDLSIDIIASWLEKLERLENVYIAQVSHLSPADGMAKALLKAQGIQSLLATPLIHAKKLLGFVGFDSVRTERAWTGDEIRLLRVTADIIANALARKQAEEALRTSEERYRSLLDRMLDGIYRSTSAGKFIDINPAMAKMFGYCSKEELLEVDIEKELYFDPSERVSQILDSGQQEIDMYRMRRKDGSEIWVEDRGYYVRDEQGKILLHEGMLRDVTKRVRAEQALRASEEKLRSIFRVAPTGIGMLKDRILVEVNPYICKMTGYAKAQLIGQSTRMLYRSQAEFEAVGWERDLGIAEKGTWSMEARWVKKDGSLINVLLSCTPIDLSDLSKGLTFTALDITEHKRAEYTLQERNQFITSLLHALPVAVFFKDKYGKYLGCNDVFTEIMGVTEEDIQGKSVHELWPSELAETYHQKDLELMRTRQHQTYEFQVKDKFGQIRPVIFAKDIFLDANGETGGMVGAFLDITERKRSEEALRLQALVLDQIQDHVTITDLNGRITYVNQAQEDMFQRSKQEIIGQTTEIYGEDAQQGATQGEIVAKTLKAGFWRGEVINFAADGSEHIMDTRTQVVRDENETPIALCGIATDITQRKRLETAISSRLVALTQPLDQPEGISFNDLFELDVIQRLQDDFSTATGVASIITAPDGTPITQPSNFCRLCIEIIRKSDTGRQNCFKSDAAIGRLQPGGPIVQPCMSGGLWDAGASISVGGRHIANWLIGQVRDEIQTEEKMREYARRIGADENDCVEAFYEVPCMPQEQFQRVARALFTIAEQMSNIAYQNVQQARFITERQKAEEALRKASLDLKTAYDATLQGWSSALELRERETAGHSQRVVQMTLELAQRMGIPDEAMIHVQHGALLHDIGKMGVPDSILLKPAQLSDDEWVIMRQHPVFAHRMLSGIPYLEPALDIPYCHHEKWDGSGYPRGLSGKAIPLAARVFAVVDVWDALSFSRPYRPAWPEDTILAYLKEQSGKHFDPRVVNGFLEILVTRQPV